MKVNSNNFIKRQSIKEDFGLFLRKSRTLNSCSGCTINVVRDEAAPIFSFL